MWTLSTCGGLWATSASCDPWLSVGPFLQTRLAIKRVIGWGKWRENAAMQWPSHLSLKINFVLPFFLSILCVCLADLHEEKESVGQEQNDFGWPSRSRPRRKCSAYVNKRKFSLPMARSFSHEDSCREREREREKLMHARRQYNWWQTINCPNFARYLCSGMK